MYAFGLLEAITRVGMPFVFKGGSCLLLLLDHPMRLSTDIDIVVKPGTDIESYIKRAPIIMYLVACLIKGVPFKKEIDANLINY